MPPIPDRKDWPTGRAEQLEPLVRRVLAPNASPYTFT
ncbi:MAG: MBL fold metallo-hydrolase, partial [Novosphingobium sp.]